MLTALRQRLHERADWLKRERENGGSAEHLYSREQECRYIMEMLATLQLVAVTPPADPTLWQLLDKARASRRVAELDLRAALSAAKDSGPLWLLLYEQVDAVAKAAVRMETITHLAALQEERARAAWEAGAILRHRYADNFVHFEGEQKERQWQAYLTQKGGAK